MIINAQDITKHYRQGHKLIKANDGITLQVKPGEFVAIIGASGSGKSTLLQLLGGLDRPTGGTLTVNGVDLAKAPEREIVRLRRNDIGFVFQAFNLIPTLTAAQNVQAAIAKRSSEDRKRCEAALKQVGLGDRSNHLPSLLSGGEQQRVAIARAIVNDPPLILADEPTGNLDSKTGEEIMALLQHLHKDKHKTIVLITHSDYVKKYADRVLEIHDGKLAKKVGRVKSRES